jgi:hypothetical protein
MKILHPPSGRLFLLHSAWPRSVERDCEEIGQCPAFGAIEEAIDDDGRRDDERRDGEDLDER